MISNILIEVISSIAEQERLTIKARQAEGIAVMPVRNGKRYSRKTGRYTGRPSTKYPDNWDEISFKWQSKEISATKAMKQLGLKPNTFYRMASHYKSKE